MHLQKNRLRPAAALFKLADANLAKYPALYERLRIPKVRELIHDWLQRLEAGFFTVNPLVPGTETAQGPAGTGDGTPVAHDVLPAEEPDNH